MSGPSDKYFGEQNEALHGSLLHWPGRDGLPFRGAAAPSLKKQELDGLPIVGESFNRVFDLSNEEQAEYYRQVRDRCRNGMFTMDFIERHWNDETKNMVIYLEWTQLYVQAKPTQPQGGNGHAGPDRNSFTIR